jgi:hypothetical protein
MTALPNAMNNAMTAPCSALKIRPPQPRMRKVPGVLGSLVVGYPGVGLFDGHDKKDGKGRTYSIEKSQCINR